MDDRKPKTWAEVKAWRPLSPEAQAANAAWVEQQMVEIKSHAEPRKPELLKGRIRIGPGFDEPLPDDILAAFRGKVE